MNLLYLLVSSLDQESWMKLFGWTRILGKTRFWDPGSSKILPGSELHLKFNISMRSHETILCTRIFFGPRIMD